MPYAKEEKPRYELITLRIEMCKTKIKTMYARARPRPIPIPCKSSSWSCFAHHYSADNIALISLNILELKLTLNFEKLSNIVKSARESQGRRDALSDGKLWVVKRWGSRAGVDRGEMVKRAFKAYSPDPFGPPPTELLLLKALTSL
ncbi:hypothetical protein HUJ05_001935 [Dendroctonus ponderosae]|nr:hypothetical protein HUJ05_001935 [Dendroctonus ponderosae]